jgi:S-methylmethionine-dependent homocysteine/selenocysteine methylase/SAM-dependent methyltransferase
VSVKPADGKGLDLVPPAGLESGARSHGEGAGRRSPAYERVEGLLAAERCVILDGGIATELEELEIPGYELRDDAMWGTWALLNAPEAVSRVHRSYVEVGCDVISTDTWGIQGAMNGGGGLPAADWMELARRGVRLARNAIAESDRPGDTALAFSLHGDIADEQGVERLKLLTRAFEDAPPDLILLETMSLVRDLTFRAVETLVESGYPVWLSFRRCRHGLCGVFGQHWGGPEGDLFGRAARRFEEMGVGALLINCIPPDHVAGMLPWLRDFTDMPLGVYPNLGYYTESGWAFDRQIGGAEYAEMASAWRQEGAQLIGGCCGVGPRHIAEARARLEGTRPGSRRAGSIEADPSDPLVAAAEAEGPPPETWTDDRGGPLYPLPMPELLVEPGVFVPTQGSFLLWKHLSSHGIGKGKRCLDVGCGTGLLTAQLALNGANHVHAIDIDRRAVANTLSNAFRNGVADRVEGEQVDLYPWDPERRYDVVVASLYQMPNDPVDQLASHRPLDYWGRSLFDHLLSLLPRLLEPDGRAYVMQLSILSQRETLRKLERHGLRARVADFAFLELGPALDDYADQIEQVEELSDAYHLRFGEANTMVAYLLEIAPTQGTAPRERRLAA